MHPVIFQIGPLSIFSYGLMLGVAFVVTTFLASQEAKKNNIPAETIFNLSFVIFVSGIAGSRILYILENLGYYSRHPSEIIMLQHGGLSWFGGLLLGTLSLFIYLKKKGLGVYRIFDLFAPFVALGQAIGRIGCLLNGCCFGVPSKFGLYFKVHDAILVPTQLYSSLSLLSIFIFLRFLQQRPHREGQIFFTYLLLSALKRFFIEFWRADHHYLIFGLTLFQLFSVVIFICALFMLLATRKTPV